jgi:hypothetical protein
MSNSPLYLLTLCIELCPLTKVRQSQWLNQSLRIVHSSNPRHSLCHKKMASQLLSMPAEVTGANLWQHSSCYAHSTHDTWPPRTIDTSQRLHLILSTSRDTHPSITVVSHKYCNSIAQVSHIYQTKSRLSKLLRLLVMGKIEVISLGLKRIF